MLGPTDSLGERLELMWRMTATTGADMMAAVHHGDMSALGLRDAVQACARCQQADQCVRWIDRNAGRTDCEPPQFCNNRRLLAQLRGTAAASGA